MKLATTLLQGEIDGMVGNVFSEEEHLWTMYLKNIGNTNAQQISRFPTRTKMDEIYCMSKGTSGRKGKSAAREDAWSLLQW